jgi:hypothetical protein
MYKRMPNVTNKEQNNCCVQFFLLFFRFLAEKITNKSRSFEFNEEKEKSSSSHLQHHVVKCS